MTNIYICGEHVKGTEEVNLEKIKNRFKTLKCSVINPNEITNSKTNRLDNIGSRVKLLKKSKAIYVLPNWRENTMARIELTVAMDLRLPMLFHPVTNKEIKQLITTLDS